MRYTRAIHRGGRTKPSIMKVKLDLFFKYAHRPDEERPENISEEVWDSVLEDYQETYDLYRNEPQLMEEKVKSYDAEETFEYLVALEETLLSAHWVNGEFAVELKLKTMLTPEKVKESLLASPIEAYLWHKSPDAWNTWTLEEKYPFAFTDYRKPANITVTQLYPGGARRRRRTVRRRA